jgi:predicted membrane chloride channel (bestrophin family)
MLTPRQDVVNLDNKQSLKEVYMSKDVHAIKSIMTLAFALANALAKELKDGFQFEDVADLLNNQAIRDAIAPALVDIKEIPGELVDISITEGFELSIFTIGQIKELIKAIKG